MFAQPEVAAMREGIARRAAARTPGPDLPEVRDLRIGELPARLYRPVPGPAPLVVYLHGGGWTIGSLDSHDRMCRRLADGSGAAVLAIDYRLAPEHPWPASVDDTVAALRWVATAPAGLGEAPTAVAVAGDSAGGTLAALGCLRLRDEYPPALPALQVLLYPHTDLTRSHPSTREKPTGC
jgi:acetyl esterase